MQDGLTPLHWHAEKGYSITAELLLGRGADVNAVNKARGCARGAGLQILVCLRYSGQQRGHAAGLSLRAGVCFVYATAGGARATDVCDTHVYLMQNDNTPLQAAAGAGHAATVELLLNHGADVNAVDKVRGWAHGARRWSLGMFVMHVLTPGSNELAAYHT